VHVALRAGGALLAFGSFLLLTHELLEKEFDAIDRSVLLAVAANRSGSMNALAVDLTALGSVAVLALYTAFGVLLLWSLLDRGAALQLLCSSVGAGLLTRLIKHLVERDRPSVVPRLVEVAGFSYPSGHSLASTAVYLTFAFITARHLASTSSRSIVIGASVVLVVTIASSRVYLGVHYPSDVVSGILLGAGWALLVDALSVALAGRPRG
jgi:undecaprenyl-diphosphatase